MIFRSKHKNEFVRVSWSAIKDNRITFEARGFLVFLLSLPDNWVFSIRGLQSMTGLPKSRIMGIVKELKEAGYISQTKKQDKKGHFYTCEWNIYETTEVNKNRSSDKPKFGQTEVRADRSLDKPKSGKCAPIHNDISIHNEISIQDEIKEKKAEPFAEILEPMSPELRETYREFIKMRKTIKAPITEKGLKLVISKAEKLANGDQKEVKEIVEQSIANSWRSVFPLKEKMAKKLEQTQPENDDTLVDDLMEMARKKGLI